MIRRLAQSALLLALLLAPVSARAGGPAPPSTRATTRGWQTLLTRPTVQNPTGIAIDPRGPKNANHWAYVADAATQRIVKFGTGGRLLGSWPYGSRANRGSVAALAVGGSGNVFAADRATGRVLKFSPSGARLATWTGFTDPRGIAVDGRGHIYVAEYGAHRVTELSPGGSMLGHWDTAAGFLQQYTVPPSPSGPLGSPIGVALNPPDSLYVTTQCRIDPTCHPHWDTSDVPYAIDGLLNLRVAGQAKNKVGNWWFGLGYSRADQPTEPPFKEAEPWVRLDAITNDSAGNAYFAGLLWPLGGKLSTGVMSYGPYGYRSGPWYLRGTGHIGGVAIDPHGNLYVTQGSSVLKLTR